MKFKKEHNDTWERNKIKEDTLLVQQMIVKEGENKMIFRIVIIVALFILFSSIIFNTPEQIYSGMSMIILSPSILVTDYFAIANIGSALFNSGIITLIGITMAYTNKVRMDGSLIAALLTLAGFSFFGKNLYNTWGIMAGVYLYSLYKKESFSKYLVQGLFGTALGPLISYITFGIELDLVSGIILGNLAGIVAGFVLPPLASHFHLFHKGFNIYNTGFTAGIIGMFFMATLRGLGYETEPTIEILVGRNESLSLFLIILFSVMLVIGLYLNDFSVKGLSELCKLSGRLPSDFIDKIGFGVVLINMSLLGFCALFYIILLGGELNGPIMGGIFTIVGFGAYGKHLMNVGPILLGVYIASLFHIYDATSTIALLAALFGTTLAPIAGYYGPIQGVFAGFLHMSITMNVSYLHGGLNLYNNGFSGGFVAATLSPMLDAIPILKNKKSSKQIL